MSIRGRFNAQKLDQRIRIDKRVETQAATGEMVPSWKTKVECHAAVDGARASGAEPYAQSGIRSVADLTFWVRADIYTRYSLVLTDRIVWQGQPYDISDIPNQQLRGRFIAIFARTGLNPG